VVIHNVTTSNSFRNIVLEVCGSGLVSWCKDDLWKLCPFLSLQNLEDITSTPDNIQYLQNIPMSYEFITSPKLTNQFLAIVHTHWQ
jgi:hypothetical protein